MSSLQWCNHTVHKKQVRSQPAPCWWFGKKPHQWEHLVCFCPSRQDWEKAATLGPQPHSANLGRASAEDSLLSSSLSPPTLMSLALFCFPTCYICLLTVHRGTGTPKGPPFYRIKRCQAQTLVLKSHYRTNYTCWYDGGIPVVCHCSQSLPKSRVGSINIYLKSEWIANNSAEEKCKPHFFSIVILISKKIT